MILSCHDSVFSLLVAALPRCDALFLALFTNFVKKVRWGGLLCLLNTYRFPICLFHVCAFAFAAQDALRLG